MKIILLDDVAKVGRRGEVREVSDGYARNFLIPKRLALDGHRGQPQEPRPHQAATGGQGRSHQGGRRGPAGRIEALVYEVSRQASEEGKLFGSVTAQDVVDFLGTRGLKVERRRAHLDEPIKGLGETAVPIRLHPEVTAHLRVSVVRQ